MPSWADPPTFTTGQVVGASALNAIADDLRVLRASTSARVSTVTPQSLSSGTWTPISFSTDVWDPEGWHTPGSPGAAEVAPKVAGVYLAVAGVEFANNSTGVRGVRIAVNDVTSVPQTMGQVLINAVQSFATHATCTALVRVNGTTDRVLCGAFQNSGSPLSTSGTVGSWLSLVWIGA